MNGAAAVIGPGIAGVLAGIGWQYPFLLTALTFPICALDYRYLLETVPATDASIANSIRTRVGTHVWATVGEFGDHNLTLLLVVSMFGFAIKYGVLTFLPLFAVDKLGASLFVIGLLLMIRSGIRIPISPQSRILIDVLNHKYALVGTISVMAATTLLIPFMSHVIVLGVVLALYSVGDGLFNPILNDTIVKIAADEQRSTVVTTVGVFKDSGNAVSPAVLGLVLAGGGFVSVFALMSGLAILAGIGLVVLFE